MTSFTTAEREYLAGQQLARLATASPDGTPDVSAVRFFVDGDSIISRGLDLTKTVRYRHLLVNPQATLVVDDLASLDPWKPRGIKVRGPAVIEDDDGKPRIRIRPETVWSWGINEEAPKRFASIERRQVD
jgi:pyridoxamine 5'-phosphate oxidase family protein